MRGKTLYICCKCNREYEEKVIMCSCGEVKFSILDLKSELYCEHHFDWVEDIECDKPYCCQDCAGVWKEREYWGD